MLLSGFLDGERGNSGEPACFIDIEPGGSQSSGVMKLQQIGAHRGEQSDRFFAGGHECVEVFKGLRSVTAKRGVQSLPDGFDTTGTDEREDILLFDSAGLGDVDRELFELGHEYSRLGADKLEQEPGFRRTQMGVESRLAIWLSQGTRSPSLGLVAVDGEPHVFNDLRQPRGGDPLLGLKQQDSLFRRLLRKRFELLPVLGYKRIGFVDDHQSLSAEERERSHFVEHDRQGGSCTREPADR